MVAEVKRCIISKEHSVSGVVSGTGKPRAWVLWNTKGAVLCLRDERDFWMEEQGDIETGVW